MTGIGTMINGTGLMVHEEWSRIPGINTKINGITLARMELC